MNFSAPPPLTLDMNPMHLHYLSSSAPATPPGMGLAARLLGFVVWATLAAMGLVFAISLLIWMVVMALVSLVVSVFTGRPAALTLLWRRYREMTRQRGPQPRGAATPRAEAAATTGGAAPTGAQDVSWREVSAPRPQADRAAPH